MTNEADIEAMAAFEDLVSKMREVLDYDFRKRTLAPPSAVGYADWNTRKAFALYKAALAASPVERLRTEMATAIRLIGEGHQDHAAERLKQALSKLPEDIRNGKHNIDRN